MDGGLLIALIRQDDPDHAMSRTGFGHLERRKTHLRVPAPVVSEVYKWTLRHAGAAAARTALARIRAGCEVLYPDQAAYDAARGLVERLQWWEGTLEDATLVVLGHTMRVPVWTLNHRDF